MEVRLSRTGAIPKAWMVCHSAYVGDMHWNRLHIVARLDVRVLICGLNVD